MPNNGGVQSSITLNVSAQIDNLKQIQSDLQQALQTGVNSNSGIFKALSNALEQVIAQTRRLTVESEKPFSSQKGIEKFNSDFVQTSNLTKRIANTMANLKFSELKIPPEALKGIENATASVQEAQAKLQALDTTKLAELAEKGNEITDVFSRAKVDITTDGLEKSLKKVSDLIVNTEKEISKLTTKAETSKLIIDNLDTQNTELSDFETLLNNDRKTWYQNNTFGKFFNTQGTLIKNQNRDAESELQTKLREYGFDDQQVAKIIASIKGKAKEIAEARQEALDIINNKKTSNSSQREKERKNLSESEAAITTLTAEQEVNKGTKQELLDVKNSEDYKAAVAQLEAEVERLKQELNALKEATRAGAEATKAGQKAYEGASANMSNFGKEVDNATDSLGKMQKAASNANSIKTAIANWMGFHQILNLGRRMIRNVIKDIQDLDKVMTEIAVVTNMTQKDLWAQMNTYQAIAREYAVSTQGVYQVSQIYYQQGLQTAEVMELTVETLKMAKIANLDYSKAADYMTVAIRGFHLEMDQASHIVDVYSKIAAVSASDTEELATAMSKTASSAAAVGSSFENTTAFIALMVETTRESAENIGSALKSIISRYGELKTSPDQLVDSEGEAMSFNKVETALQSVGITMHDVNGQFKDFDDIIIELSSKWDTLDTNTQRYIATVMAGNRQQSRFIALVSGYDRLSELVEEAANADDAATLQTLKTMDSLESKIQNLKNAWQGFYANLGLEEVFKKGLDFLTGVINRLNNMPKLLGKIPVVAITIITNAVNVIKGLATSFINYVVKEVDRIRDALKNSFVKGASEGTDGAKKVVENKTLSSQISAKAKAAGGAAGIVGRIASVGGTALTTGALAVGDDKAATRGIMTGVGGLLSAVGNIAVGFTTGGPYGALMAALSSIPNLIATAKSAFYDLTHAEELYLKALKERLEKQQQEALVSKNEAKTYQQALEKLENLTEHQYDSNEAYQELVEYRNSLVDTYPQLLDYYDSEGNALISNTALYRGYAEAIRKAKEAEKGVTETEVEVSQAELAQATSEWARIQSVNFGTINAFSSDAAKKMWPEFGKEVTRNMGSATVTEKVFSLERVLESPSAFIEQYKSLPSFSQDNLREALLSSLNIFRITDKLDLKRFGWDSIRDIDTIEDLENLFKLLAEYQGKVEQATQTLSEVIEKDSINAISLSLSNIIENWVTKGQIENDSTLTLSRAFNSDLFSKLLYHGYGSENTDTQEEITNIAESWKTIIIQLGKEGWKNLANILEHPEQYTSPESMQQEIVALLTSLGIELENIPTQIWDYIYGYVELLEKNKLINAQEKNKGIITQISQQSKEAKVFATGLDVIFTSETLDLIQSRYYDLFSNWLGQINQFYSSGNTTMGNAFSLLSIALNRALAFGGQEIQDNLFTALLGVDFTNKESVENLIAQINDMIDNATDEEDRTALTAIKDNIQTYSDSIYELLNTQIERITEKATQALSSYEETLKTGSKGFTDLSEISAIATKFTDMSAIGENIDSNAVFYFDELEGAYFYTQTALDQLREKYYHSIDVEIQTIQDNLDAAADELLSLDDANISWDAPDAKTFFNLGESEELTLVQEQFYNWFKTQTFDADKTYDDYVQAWIDELQARQTVLAKGTDNLFDALQYQNALSNFPINDILAGTVESVTNWEYNIAQWLRLQYDGEASIEQYAQLLQDLNNGKAKAKDWAILYKILKDAKVDDIYDKLLTSYTRDAAALASTLSSLSSLSLGSSITLNEEQITALFKAGYYKNTESLEEVLSGGLQTLTYGAEGFKDAISALLNSASNALRAGELTLEEYNKQVTQFAAFDTEGWGATPIIDAFGKASSLTADAVADIASSLGFTLREDFKFDQLTGITDYNGHQMVTDMQSFIYSLYTQASDSIKSFDDLEINWNDPRIVEAQSKLNEAFIQQQQAMLEAQTKQLSAIGSIKPGQQFLDLSYVWKGLDKEVRTTLASQLENIGAHIGEDTGLLELGNASIFNVAEVIKNSVGQTEEAVAALEDAIISLLESLTDLLSKGLEGSLSNTEALDFSKMVSSRYGIDEIGFTETEKGLKLSADSAEKLAQELYKAGTFQEKLAFKEYAKSLAGQAGTYKDIYSTMRKLKELETERAKKNGDITEDLRYQLALTREIAYAQMADTDSYNFMDFKMPSDFNGPANYWSSWETFMSKFREAKTNGYMEIEDFYNMINAVNALASDTNKITLFGQELNGSLESASAAIQAGFKTIGQIDGKGAMITFKGMGDDIFSGMESFGTSIDTGIHEFAQSQIDMIDALIGFVKAMAIMEDMGKLDIDSDGLLEFTDLFEESGKILPAAATAIDNILGNKDLEDALTSVKIGGKTLQDILIRVKDGSAEDIELLNQWYQIAKQMDFDITDINSIYQSIKDGLLNISSDTSYEISMGDETLIIDKGVVLVKKLYRQDDGTTSEMITTSDGKEFTDETEAYNHEILLNEGKDKTDFKLIDSTTATYTLGEATITIKATDKSIVYLDKNGAVKSSLKEALLSDWSEGALSDFNSLTTEQQEQFKGYLATQGLEVDANGEVVYKMAPEQASLEDRQLTAAEGLATATEGNTTAVNNLTSAINTLAALSCSTPREIMSAWESWDNPHGKEKKWDDFLQDYVQLHILTSPTTTSESIVDLTPNAASLPNTNISNEEHALLQVAELTSQLADAQEQTSLYRGLYQQKLEEAADLDAQIGTLTDQLTAKEEELASVKAEGEAAVEAAKAEGEAAVAAIKAEYESRITALNNTIDTLQETLAQTEANRVLAWQTATDWQKQLADKENENATLLAQLNNLLESAKTDKNIPDDVYETAEKIAEQAYQAEREASANGETSGYIHVPTTPPESTQSQPIETTDEETAEGVQQLISVTQAQYDALKAYVDALQSGSRSDEYTAAKQVYEVGAQQYLGQAIENSSDLDQAFKVISGLPTLEGLDDNLRDTEDSWIRVAEQATDAGSTIESSSKDAASGLEEAGEAGESAAPALRGIGSAAGKGSSNLNNFGKAVFSIIESLHSYDTRLRGITQSLVGSGAKPTGFLSSNSNPNLSTKATGSFGNALSAGTLMGELGPELWVSHGHYYVAGQNGAEFVNLPDDAIVFNHLQTERLLGKGKVGGHGKPVTNERKATSLATGNVHGGLAMASASDTLAQLEQLRAMWEAIAKMPVSDLGKKAGSGGGGGGGGSDDTKAFIGDLQRWFNLEQQIAKLEKDITEQQKIRAKLMGDQVAHGKQIYESYRKEFDALTAEIDATQELTDLQKDWYQHRVDQFNATGLNSIFTFDRETGLMQYTGDDKKGNGGGLDILATLYQTDAYGAPINPQGEKWDANGQLNYLRSQGISDTVLKSLVDSEGKTLVKLAKDGSLATDEKGNISMANGKTSSDLIEAFDTVINSWKDEMTELYDTYHENQMKVYDLQNNQNEIIQEVIDNQLSLEQRVLTALIDKAQKAIDDLQDSRDALADANQKYIDGLNDSLQKQKDMYDRNEAANDLNKLQRQLAILQRSGGSASQIRSLQQQINDQMQDAYFTAQQDQISAIQEAADKQIERLDYQIDLMTQTLEYQKENGLLWDEVYRIMTTLDDADILAYIQENTASLQGISSLDLRQQLKDASNEIGIFKADWAEQVGQAVATSISQSRYHEPEHIESNIGAKNQESTSSGTAAPASTSKGGGSGSGSGNTGNNNGDQSKGVLHITYHVICTSGLTKGEATGGSPKGPSTLQIGQSGTISWNPYSGYAQGGFSISDTSKASISGSKITAKAAGSVVITLKYWDRNTNTATNGKTTSSDKSVKMQKYAEGGLVDYTGPAQVHGSKSKPESFFDAQSTAILRDDVLGSINVLDSLLADVSTAGTNSLNLGTNESLSITNPVININVDKIANDYDAKRAGQLAFDEMVKIARQSGNRSLSRR